MSTISVPAASKAPRQLDPEERIILRRVANTLVPAEGTAPAAGAEPGFWEALSVALDARADAFGDITEALATLAPTESDELWSRLRSLDREHPATFQALSAVIVGAWLLTPGVQDRIGYHGQQSEKASLEDAADEIASGVLDPVIERAPRWIR